MNKVIIAFVPVLHEGYRRFFEKHKDANTLYIFGGDITSQFDYLKKEIRALDPKLIQNALTTWNIVPNVQILDTKNIEEVAKHATKIVMPREDITEELAEKYFEGKKIEFDSIFLRWDKHNSIEEKPVTPEEYISREEFDKKMMVDLEKEASKSADFWRHVGAALVKDGKVISMTYNHHVPSDHSPYVNGDPRNAFKKGLNIEISTVIHAEAGLIADAAKKGISLEGMDMYVTVFPCPPCAKLIAYSGIKKLYCGGGYAVLDGEDILKSKGVKIIFVESDNPEEKKKWKGYQK